MQQYLIKMTYLGVLFCLGNLLSCIPVLEPPRKVKNAIRSEEVFAALIFLPALMEFFFYNITIISRTLFVILFFNALGLAWFVLVCFLAQGKKWARKVCVLLSVIRIFSIIGLPFSLITLISLREKESIDYFSEKL